MEISLPPDLHTERIVEALADGRPRRPRDIWEPAKLNANSTRNRLLDLVRAGRVVREGQIGWFHYRLADAAEEGGAA